MSVRRFVVHGRVQGVGFRVSLRAEAVGLGLTGWVRNREDGTVEALAAGPDESVQALLDWASHGPPFAHVTRVEQHPAPGTPLPTDFRITP
jgi:acylphosphatase